MNYIICLICLTVMVLTRVCAEFPVVNSDGGVFYGLRGVDFVMFLGIPYGSVDENDKFGPAKPPITSSSPYYAQKSPVICPQIVNGIPAGNIHCLHLNVYVPNNANKNSTLPVMVFIHGGGFIDGDGNLGSYSPKFLVKKNVIVVTVNYRLGHYGFVCLDQVKYNNQGLKDQRLALDWIKSHIQSFGGDNNNILLFGHSAGSMSVDINLLFNINRVFNKVILQSGQALSPYLAPYSPNDSFIRKVATRLSINEKSVNTEEVLKELSNVDSLLLINVTRNDLIRPCMDGELVKESIENINLKDVKIMIGHSFKEMIFFYKDVTNISKRISEDLEAGFVNISDNGVNDIKFFYGVDDGKKNVINMGTDFVFSYPIERSIRYYVRDKATVYRYLFSYDGKRNFVKFRDDISDEGATHGDELGYLFDMEMFGDTITKEDEKVIDTMTTLWTNFAKYGNPTPTFDTSVETWPKIEKGNDEYIMNINSSAKIQKGFLHKDFWALDVINHFWDSIYCSEETIPRGIKLDDHCEDMSNGTGINFGFSAALVIAVIVEILLHRLLY